PLFTYTTLFRSRTERLYSFVLGDGFFAAFDHPKTPFVAGLSVNRSVDGAICRIGNTLNECMIVTIWCSITESLFEPAIGNFSLCHNHNPDVPTSRRCTIPGRSGGPEVAIRMPKA